jgi:hypothetical protein
MKLTLRTLLAYLDDTLEPSEIKQIGQKVAESDAAQELIARLKQVTRRRRLTTPPDTGKGESFDPNTVAAYLDNELPSEQVAETEKICLDSDVHLAEVAACHQILTLVLGEPALVPPTAKERMYGLVKGREAIPFRKAPDHTSAGDGGDDENEDAMLSVLAFHRQQSSWKRWALPIAGVVLFLTLPVVLVIALMQGSNPPKDTRSLVVAADKSNADKGVAKDGDGTKDKTKDGEALKDKDKQEKDTADKDKPPADKPNSDKPNQDAQADKDKPKKDGDGGKIERPAEPSPDRREVAIYQGPPKAGSPSVLVYRPRGEPIWKRLSPNTPVFTSDALVSLPGYASEVITGTGVRLDLWGTHPKFTPAGIPPNDFFYESAVVLHANRNFDLELTLIRGRIFLSNAKDKGSARVRLRFQKEIWDITLTDPDSEVAVDYYTHYPLNIDWKRDEPRAVAALCVIKGHAGLRVEYEEFPSMEIPGPAFVFWDSYGKGLKPPQHLDRPYADFTKDIPASKDSNDLREALDAISKRMGEKKAVGIALKEIVEDGPVLQRLHCIECLGAIDAVPTLLDILDGKDDARARDRREVLFALHRWACRGLDFSKQLFDLSDRKSGILLDKKYSPSEAEIVLTLLHDFDDVKKREPETFDTLADYLTNSRMAIRELGNWHLLLLSQGAKSIPEFNAAWDQDKRSRVADDWKAMIKAGQLPPPPMGPPGVPPK